MLHNGLGKAKQQSLMSEYASLLGDAVLRHRTRVAEQTAQIESEVAGRVKSEFISNMSHELRTPLNTVIGFSKLLSEHQRRRLADNEIVEYSQLIVDAATHLLSVINDILDISKMQSGKYSLDAREFSLEDVIGVTLSGLSNAATEAGVTVSSHIAFNLATVRGDATKVRQIFTNILSNAVKFTRRGGSVQFEARRTNDGGTVVAITDTGVGMTDEEIRIALTPFGQVDGTRSRWREGTGLGLPIAKALVDLHGGELDISSLKGQGTTVTIVFPPADQVSVAGGRQAMFGN